MDQVVRIGMLGSGFIADFNLDGLRDVSGAVVTASASSGSERGRDFATRHGIPRTHVRDGYTVNATLDAAYRSMQSGSWEPIGLDAAVLAA